MMGVSRVATTESAVIDMSVNKCSSRIGIFCIFIFQQYSELQRVEFVNYQKKKTFCNIICLLISLPCSAQKQWCDVRYNFMNYQLLLISLAAATMFFIFFVASSWLRKPRPQSGVSMRRSGEMNWSAVLARLAISSTLSETHHLILTYYFYTYTYYLCYYFQFLEQKKEIQLFPNWSLSLSTKKQVRIRKQTNRGDCGSVRLNYPTFTLTLQPVG